MAKGGESGSAPKSAGCLKSVVGLGLGLALGALAGVRLRRLPMTPERVKSALGSEANSP